MRAVGRNPVAGCLGRVGRRVGLSFHGGQVLALQPRCHARFRLFRSEGNEVGAREGGGRGEFNTRFHT